MQIILEFWHTHQTTIALALGWLFSAAMSTMPPLSSNAGFFGTWVYKFLQAIAANFNKHDNPQGIAGSTKQ